jgi:hypothetical protein
VSTITRQKSENRKRLITRRLVPRNWPEQTRPMMGATGICYDIADRARGIAAGGVGAMLMLARRVGLVATIDRRLELLKAHVPYQESDHVLNVAFNILAGGRCLEDLELLRQDEGYLNALGAQRIPDPTTAGDFCRRFTERDVESLMDAINESRLKVWRQQSHGFFDEAVIDADGTLAPTLGECKEGADFAYNGVYGYHPLLISLANTQEPLFLVNRSGNRPSHEGAAARLDQAIALCREAGFRRITMRGDTDYSQTRHLDRWDADGVGFVFGIARLHPLYERTAELPDSAWRRLRRPPKHEVKTQPRSRRANVKDRIVRCRGFMAKRTDAELVASFAYQPTACSKPYRIVVLRKNLTISRGEEALLDDMMFFYFITNDWKSTPAEIVLRANGRCNQENLNAQLKSGVAALEMPVGDLVSNWAYMVMASLAWTLKAWLALLLPARGRWAARHQVERDRVLRMEFPTFLRAFMLVPAQIVRTGRRVVYRLLGWNPWQHVLLRAVDVLNQPLRC